MSSVCEGVTGPALLWLDLLGKVDRSVVDRITELLEIIQKQHDLRVILTCSDEFSGDDDHVECVEELEEELACERHEVGQETGIPNIFADQLHEEFKLISSFNAATADGGRANTSK